MSDIRNTPNEPDIIHADRVAIIDVRQSWNGWEVCVMPHGGTHARRVGVSDDRPAAQQSAEALARHPRQALAFAGF